MATATTVTEQDTPVAEQDTPVAEQVQEYAELRAELAGMEAKQEKRAELSKVLVKRFGTNPEGLDAMIDTFMSIAPAEPVEAAKPKSKSGSGGKGTRNRDEIRKRRDHVLAALRDNGGKATVPQIAQALNITPATVTADLRALSTKDGAVKKTDETVSTEGPGQDAKVWAVA